MRQIVLESVLNGLVQVHAGTCVLARRQVPAAAAKLLGNKVAVKVGDMADGGGTVWWYNVDGLIVEYLVTDLTGKSVYEF